MSEGEPLTSVGLAVIGEPASEPHQAVVVGEPQEDAAPVLGEPVPFANGLQGQEAVPPPGADEPAVNGVQVNHRQDNAPTQDQEGGLDPPRTPDESPASSVSSADVNASPPEAPVEENPNTPDATAEENLSPPDSHVEETPSAPDASAEEASSAPAVDAPGDENSSTEEDPNAREPSTDATEAPSTADASIESPGPVEVSPEIHTENLCSPLEEASAAQKDGLSETLTVDPVADEQSIIEATSTSAAPDEDALPTQVKLSHEGSGACQASQPEGFPFGEVTAAPATQEPPNSQILLEGVPVTDSKVAEAAYGEAIDVGPAQVSQRDTPLQQAVTSDIVSEKPIDEEAEEIKLTDEVPSAEGTKTKEYHGVESHHIESDDASYEEPSKEYHGVESHHIESDDATYEESSVDPSLGVAHATPEEVAQAEGSINGDQMPRKDALNEGDTLLGSHQVPNCAESPVEALVLSSIETPVRSQTTRETPGGVYTLDQSSTGEIPPEGAESLQGNAPAAANGENGFQSVEDVNHAGEREQDFLKDDENSAEGKEKASTWIKLPLIVTGLAIAAVGVAVASISRPH